MLVSIHSDRAVHNGQTSLGPPRLNRVGRFFLTLPESRAARMLRKELGNTGMDDEPTHLSRTEVRRALDRLRPAEILRLSLLARHWARACANV